MPTRLCISLAILASLIGCGSSQKSQVEVPQWVRVALPEVSDQPEGFALSGTVMTQGAPQTLSFQVPGRVVTVGPREGELARKGQVLASLENSSYAAALATASSQKRAAQAALSRAQDELQRMKLIYERQSLAENDFLKFKLAEQTAREQLLQAEAQEKVARKALGDTHLSALVGGVVTRRSVEPGVMVAAGQPAFEIAQVDPVEIQIGIPENLAGSLKIGQTAVVTLPSLPGTRFEGTLRVINATADPASRTYMARVALKNPKGVLRLGMVAEARIRGERRERMLLVPCEAIVKDLHGASVVYEFRAGENRVLARRVTLGALEGNRIQVLSGIDASTRIVVAGQNFLRDGSPAQVEGEKSQSLSGGH